jgi:GTPase SAR1 family protein
MTAFGQLVFGPPGSGKTKYCSIMHELLTSLGRRVHVINLDPANDRLYYDCSVNIFDLINIQDVMLNLNLGPNGALIYCMEFLEANIDWLVDSLAKLCKQKMTTNDEVGGAVTKQPPAYLLFDLPGQVELYTHHTSVRNIIAHLTNKLDYRLCSVNLVDSYYATDPAKFISVLLMSLSSMLQIELPHVNVLSKMDLIKQYGNLKFNLDFYTDVLDLGYLAESIGEEEEGEAKANTPAKAVKFNFSKKFKKLNEKISELVQDYSLVSFLTLNIQKRQSVIRCIQQIDKANGYLFGHLDDQDLINSYMGNVNSEDVEVEDVMMEEDEEGAEENDYY